MQVKTHDLESHLAKRLAPVYLISGDETLLVQEACDSIVAGARNQGFTERELMHVERGFAWHEVLHSAASMSLFADKKIIDLRLSDAKFDKEASAVLREYLQEPADDTLLLIRCARLDPRQRQSAWVKAIDAAGTIVLVWPVSIRELPRWLQGRLRTAGVELTSAALQAFVERTEGNLLAAVQEINKLRLAELANPIDVPELLNVLVDATHYDVFEFLDALLAADAKRVSRMLSGMQAEGVALFAILGALGNLLRSLHEGRRVPGPPQRQRLADGFLRRHDHKVLQAAISELALLDSQGKGALLGDAWQSLARLCLKLAGDSNGAALATVTDYLPHIRRA